MVGQRLDDRPRPLQCLAGKQLWLVPIDGGTPTALTAPNNGQKGPDYGDITAWQLPAGTYVQALGACGVIFLAKLNGDGTTSSVSVPEVHGDTIVVVGVNGGDLDLQAKAGCGAASHSSTTTRRPAPQLCCSGRRSTAAASSPGCRLLLLGQR